MPSAEDREPVLSERLAATYDELKVLARRYLSTQRAGHTLQPTALVHEAYLRVARRPDIPALGSQHFVALAARAMRSVLVDHARSRNRQKRGGQCLRMPLDDVVDSYERRSGDLGALDEALERLAAESAETARLVELRFFGGVSSLEASAILGVSARTAERLWERARAWLRRELTTDEQREE